MSTFTALKEEATRGAVRQLHLSIACLAETIEKKYTLSPGSEVVLGGLKTKGLNGQPATVEGIDAKTGRIIVKLKKKPASVAHETVKVLGKRVKRTVADDKEYKDTYRAAQRYIIGAMSKCVELDCLNYRGFIGNGTVSMDAPAGANPMHVAAFSRAAAYTREPELAMLVAEQPGFDLAGQIWVALRGRREMAQVGTMCDFLLVSTQHARLLDRIVSHFGLPAFCRALSLFDWEDEDKQGVAMRLFAFRDGADDFVRGEVATACGMMAAQLGGHRFGIIRSKDGTTADMVEGLLATGMHGLHVDA